jgi:N-acetylmuramoyl-L-alanine amidase
MEGHKMNYEITHDYIKHGKARSGTKLIGPLFGVAHDIGSGCSTARQNMRYFNNHQPSASAHVFIDDKEILVIIPLDEKAWHVQYQKPMDNLLFGDDANDAGIGVELCWGGKINFAEAYKRYVWFWAWLCKKYKWNPHKHIVSHKTLDPERRSDPDNALNKHGITFAQFLDDVAAEMKQRPILTVPVVKEAVKKPVTKKKDYLEKGDRGDAVKALQRKLSAVGFTLTEDGIFGEKTDAAIRTFQKRSNLVVDGLAGSQTIAKLDAVLRKEEYPGHLIKRGSSDKTNVKKVQKAVGVSADGIFGSKTEAAVKAFQKKKKITADGIVGPATWNLLF